MTALAHPIEGLPAERLLVLAHEIQSGDLSGLPRVEREYFEFADWLKAATASLDSGDTSELAWMIAWERGFGVFNRLPDTEQSEWGDFGLWFERNRASLENVA